MSNEGKFGLLNPHSVFSNFLLQSPVSTSFVAQPEVIDLTEIDENDSEVDDQEGSERSSNGGSDSEQSSDDSDDTTEVEMNRDSRSQLYRALSAVPEARIRQILSQLIEQVPAVEYALTREFVTLKRKPDVYDSENTKTELCTKCHEEYDGGTERVEDECAFHPGASFLLYIVTVLNFLL